MPLQDFRKRAHVPLSGWPFRRSALEPFYERAQRLLEVGVFDLTTQPRRPCHVASWLMLSTIATC